MTSSFGTSIESARLEELYAISTLFTAFETIEKTLGAAIGIVARTLPLHSASVIESMVGARANLTIWAPAHAANDQVEVARAHVVEAYAYLAGNESPGELEVRASVIAGALPAPPRDRTTHPGRFIVLPLVVAKGPVFGALQLEGAEPLSHQDLMFANMIANQLAVALVRHRAWRHEVDQRTAAQAARESYELLIDNLECAVIWEADAPSRRLSYANAQLERLLGFSRHTCLREPDFWVHHTHPDDRDWVTHVFERAFTEGGGKRCEHRVVTADGQVRWLHTGIHVVSGGHQQPRFQGVSMDITASKMAEDRVREQLAFTNAMASSIGDGTIAVDLDGKITFINAAAEALLQCTQHDVRSSKGIELARIEAEDGAALEHPLDATIRTGHSIRSDEHVLVRRDGRRFSVSYTATPILRSSAISGAVLAFDDISERKRVRNAEHFLLEASEQLGASLETAAVLGALARVGVPQLGDLCFVDVAAPDDDRLLRTAWAHVDPRQHAELQRVYKMSPPVSFLIQPVARVVTAGCALLVPLVDDAWLEAAATSSADLAYCRGLGITSAMVIPLCAGKRRLGALTFYAHGRRFTEQDLALAEELARRGALALEHARLYGESRRAIGAREQMLAIVSHDLRTPLSTIVMASGLLREPNDDDSRALVIQKIERAANRMDRLIGDLLDFASIQGGGLAMMPRAHELSPIVEEAVASFEELAKTHLVHLAVELVAAHGRVFGDRDRLLQVLGNLISNALKVTPKGGSVRVTVKTREREAVFAVADSGPGIPLAEQARLFERYWRSPETSYKGTGLGLAIAQGIIEAHGGRIWVDSEVGCGATFFFTVPVASDRHAPELRAVELSPKPAVDE
ncbi:MAG: ATP-binding protein [Kofleriaceae bacterium]